MHREFDQSCSLVSVPAQSNVEKKQRKYSFDPSSFVAENLVGLSNEQIDAELGILLARRIPTEFRLACTAIVEIKGNAYLNAMIERLQKQHPEAWEAIQVKVPTQAEIRAGAGRNQGGIDFIGGPTEEAQGQQVDGPTDSRSNESRKGTLIESALAARFQRCVQIDVSDVCVVENPELTRQGQRGVAIEGRCIELSPRLMGDQSLCLHELAHIGQQRGGSPNTEKSLSALEEIEREADSAAKAALEGKSFELSAVSGFKRLYSDESTTEKETPKKKPKPNVEKGKITLLDVGKDEPGVVGKIRFPYSGEILTSLKPFDPIHVVLKSGYGWDVSESINPSSQIVLSEDKRIIVVYEASFQHLKGEDIKVLSEVAEIHLTLAASLNPKRSKQPLESTPKGSVVKTQKGTLVADASNSDQLVIKAHSGGFYYEQDAQRVRAIMIDGHTIKNRGHFKVGESGGDDPSSFNPPGMIKLDGTLVIHGPSIEPPKQDKEIFIFSFVPYSEALKEASEQGTKVQSEVFTKEPEFSDFKEIDNLDLSKTYEVEPDSSVSFSVNLETATGAAATATGLAGGTISTSKPSTPMGYLNSLIKEIEWYLNNVPGKFSTYHGGSTLDQLRDELVTQQKANKEQVSMDRLKEIRSALDEERKQMESCGADLKPNPRVEIKDKATENSKGSLTLYHGTDEDAFKSIQKDGARVSGGNNDDFGRGFYVSEDINVAKKSSGKGTQVIGRIDLEPSELGTTFNLMPGTPDNKIWEDYLDINLPAPMALALNIKTNREFYTASNTGPRGQLFSDFWQTQKISISDYQTIRGPSYGPRGIVGSTQSAVRDDNIAASLTKGRIKKIEE